VFLKESVMPSTNGASGPTIIKFIFFSTANSFNLSKSFSEMFIFCPTIFVPVFPGAKKKVFTLAAFRDFFP
jgi:hypothetical protein